MTKWDDRRTKKKQKYFFKKKRKMSAITFVMSLKLTICFLLTLSFIHSLIAKKMRVVCDGEYQPVNTRSTATTTLCELVSCTDSCRCISFFWSRAPRISRAPPLVTLSCLWVTRVLSRGRLSCRNGGFTPEQ